MRTAEKMSQEGCPAEADYRKNMAHFLTCSGQEGGSGKLAFHLFQKLQKRRFWNQREHAQK